MSTEERLFSFYMHEAAARPLTFLKMIKDKTLPSYWEEYWAYYAALRMEDYDYVELIYKKYIEEEDVGNDYYILLAYEAYVDHINNPDDEECVPTGNDFLTDAEPYISPLLREAWRAMRSLLSEEKIANPDFDSFYVRQLFVPQKHLSIRTIRESLDDTKIQEEWCREINYLTDSLAYIYVDSMLHVPDGWEGMTLVPVKPFELTDNSQRMTCYGMWKKGECDYELCLSEDRKAPETMALERIKSMRTYRQLVLLLLDAIAVARRGPYGWS